ncbi:hypothetical protein LUZ60_009917 [Juncus effusus]|nr:hypothetical protein LUZ60_009917 [Juncus effusus]
MSLDKKEKMANKRKRDDQEEDPEMTRDKQIRKSPSLSLSSVVKQVMMANFQQDMAVAIEPLMRKVVREEVQRVLLSLGFVDRKLEMQTISPEKPSYHLSFKYQPHIPIFSGSKIEDTEGSPLQILLIPTGPSSSSGSSSLPSQIKIEFVVLPGDFPSNDDWTSDEFEKAIVKEREGRKPLLIGPVNNITMRNGYVMTGDLQFTDNSSWIRSRHFRIGVRVVKGSCQGGLIKEAITEKFIVKDHRGELYKKHYPPALTDNVWRMKKIAKEGVFHKKLSEYNINNVQDFLKLWNVYPGQLRQILGSGMTDNMWKITINHAQTCDLGSKVYFYCKQNVVIFLNSICQVVRIKIGDVQCTFEDLNRNTMDFVQQMILEAYKDWANLMEADEMISETVVQGGSGSLQYHDLNSQEFGTDDYQVEDLDEVNSSGSFFSEMP